MNDRDYIIAVDEHGQPYIAHAQVQTDLRPGSKSIAKLVEGSKVLRYFKDNAELQAYYQNARGAVKGAVDKVKGAVDNLGIKERQALKSTEKQAAKEVKDNWNLKDTVEGFKTLAARMKLPALKAKYGRTTLGQIEKSISEVPDKVRGAASSAAGKVRDFADRVDSRDEKAALEEAKANYQKALQSGSAGELGRAVRALQAAQEDYDSTYEARARSAAGRAGEAVRGAASSAADKVRGVAGRAGETVRGAADRAIDKVSSRDEKAARDEAYDKWQRAKGTDDELQAWAEYDGAQKRYDNTLGARASSAYASASDTLRGAASSGIEQARELAAATADKTYARTAKAEYDKAVQNYERSKGTDDELSAYWEMMDAQRALDKARGLLGKI